MWSKVWSLRSNVDRLGAKAGKVRGSRQVWGGGGGGICCRREGGKDLGLQLE